MSHTVAGHVDRHVTVRELKAVLERLPDDLVVCTSPTASGRIAVLDATETVPVGAVDMPTAKSSGPRMVGFMSLGINRPPRTFYIHDREA